VPEDALDGQCPVCLERLVASADQPTRIGRYKILQEIGKGGCGVVYMAEQQEPVKRRVALKVIKPGMDTKEVLGRFEAERQALALMDHPNIAKVLDAGTTDTGRAFFVMELVRGIPITRYCDENKLNTEQRLELFIKVCQAIQHAHQKGIIHRDIKPSNILVADHDGMLVPMIIDFGLAKAAAGQTLTDKTVFTALEQFIGTPAYMSPEQANLSGLDIDTRSDIYSLGVLLYELLTGKTPFDAKRLFEAGLDEIRRIIREEEPQRPSQKFSTLVAEEQAAASKSRQTDSPRLIRLVRGDLDWIVMMCLEKQRNRRYETANGLAMDIRRHLNSEPVVARPPSQIYRFRKMVGRNKLAFAAASAVSLALLAGTVVSTWQATRAIRAEREQSRSRKEAEMERDQKKALLARNRIRTSEDYFADNPSIALAYLSRVLRDDPENRTAAQRLLSALSYRTYNLPQAEPLLHKAAVNSARFSPDGAWVVTASDDGTAQIWNARTGNPKGQPFRHGGAISWAEFSPDSQWLLTASSDHTAKVWDIQTGNSIATLLGHTKAVSSGHFSMNGQLVITASDDGSCRIWVANTGEPVGSPLQQRGRILSAQFSPDANLVVTSSHDDNTAQVWDAHTGARVGKPLQHDNLVCAAEFSPDGQWVVTGSWDRTARVWDSHTGEPAMGPLNHAAALRSVHFSPDGKWLLTGTMSGNVLVWNAATGSNEMTFFMNGRSPVNSAEFSPDGNWVVAAAVDGTIRVWNRLTGRPAGEPMRHLGSIHSVEFNRNGNEIISASEDRTAQIWRFSTNSVVIKTFSHNNLGEINPVTQAVFSHDGQRLLTSSSDHTARVWDVETLRVITTLPHDDLVNSARFSPDDKWVVTASFDETARVWDARTGIPVAGRLHPPYHIKNPILSAEFSPDGNRVATGSFSGGTDVWDAREGTHLIGPLFNRPSLGEIKSVKFSPDGHWLVSAADGGTAQVWDATTGNPVGEPLQHLEAVASASFSPDSRLVVTASWDGTARVWNSRTSSQVLNGLLRHQGIVVSAEFSHDGRKIATASLDGTARLWDTYSGQPLTEPLRHRGYVTSAEFSADDHLVVTASWDGTARVWDSSNGLPVSEPLQHHSRVNSAHFNTAGDMVLTASDDGNACVWPVMITTNTAPEWLSELAEALAGERLTETGQLELVGMDKVLEIREKLAQSKLPKDSFTRWLEWFMGDNKETVVEHRH
jgi:WD40 repeat protein/tRNA A-37 threonylcarbamoyl transferase component Bud32